MLRLKRTNIPAPTPVAQAVAGAFALEGLAAAQTWPNLGLPGRLLSAPAGVRVRYVRRERLALRQRQIEQDFAPADAMVQSGAIIAPLAQHVERLVDGHAYAQASPARAALGDKPQIGNARVDHRGGRGLLPFAGLWPPLFGGGCVPGPCGDFRWRGGL